MYAQSLHQVSSISFAQPTPSLKQKQPAEYCKKAYTRPVDKQILRILFCLYTPLRKGWPAHSAMMVFHSTAMSDINHFPLAQGTLSQNAPTKRRDRRRRCDSITCARAFTRNERIAPSAWIDGMMMYTIWLGALSVGNQLLMTRSSTA